MGLAQAGQQIGSELNNEIQFNSDVSVCATYLTRSWIDPRTGESQPAGHFANTGVVSFTTPDGWEDALLVLSALAER